VKLGIHFKDVDTGLWAQQITLMESEVYRCIEAKEFFGQAWSKKDKAIKSPNILMMSQNFNKVTNLLPPPLPMSWFNLSSK